MDLDQMLKRIDERTKKDLEESEAYYESLPEGVAEPVDVYQRDANARFEEFKKVRPRGSSALVLMVTKSIIDGEGMEDSGLASAYDEAKDMVESLREQGENNRAEIARKQYMEDRFIPSIETVITYTSPDELLNCREALRALDKCALGVGSMDGYTASYVRSAYGDLLGKDLDNRFGTSDPYVCHAVGRIKSLVYQDKIRAAMGVAKQIKKSIDAGQNMANEDDYSLISRVANF